MPKTTDAPQTDPFADLSWNDLEQWVGARSLECGRSYQRKRRVLLLARTPDGTLSGRVVGSSLYTTRVTPRAGDLLSPLLSVCSCPLGGNCKHAVAVVLEYLDRRKAGKEIPSELPATSGGGPDTSDAGPDEQNLDDAGGTDGLSETPRRGKDKSRRSGKVDVKAYLQALTTSELVELVGELAETSAEARRLLETRAQLATGRIGEIVSAARKELRRVASEHGWRNSWTGEGDTPNYDLVTKYLSKLLAAGQPDLVLELGREVLELGAEQVGQSDDEGDTGVAISDALVPVWEALSQSSLSPAARILWVYDRYLEDEYDLCNGSGEADVWEVESEVWGQVADALVDRLAGGYAAGVRAEHDSSLRYRRSNIAWSRKRSLRPTPTSPSRSGGGWPNVRLPGAPAAPTRRASVTSGPCNACWGNWGAGGSGMGTCPDCEPSIAGSRPCWRPSNGSAAGRSRVSSAEHRAAPLCASHIPDV